MADPKLMIDRSRPYASVHGENALHAFEQDGLPFNQMGELVAKLVTTKDQKALVEKKLKRQAKLAAGAPVEPAEGENAKAEQADDDDDTADIGKEINLEAWLKDEVQYEPNLMFKEAKKRYGKHFTTYQQLAEYLVYEENVCGPSEVPTKLPKAA